MSILFALTVLDSGRMRITMPFVNGTLNKMNWSRLVQELIRHMSRTQLANRIDVTPKEISRWIKGEHQPQSEPAEALLKECAHLGINHRKYEGLKPIYAFERSFEQNIADGPGWFPPEPYALPKMGIKLWDLAPDSVLGIPASVLTANSNWILPFSKRGFDVFTAKTRRSRLLRPHPFPNLAHVPELTTAVAVGSFPKAVLGAHDSACGELGTISLANSFGMPSEEPHEWQADLMKTRELLAPNQVLIASVVGTADDDGGDLVADFVRVAKLAADVHPDAIELNFSCPNVYGKEGSIYNDPHLAEQICKKVNKEIGGIKLVVKIGYLAPEPLRLLFDNIFRHVDGIAAINTVPASVLSAGQRDEPLFPGQNNKRKTGGVSGVAIKNHALNVVQGLRKLADQRKSDLVIFGMGGVSDVGDVKRFIDSGANCVQICSAAMLNPLVAAEIRREWAGQKGMHQSRAIGNLRLTFQDDFAADTIARAFEVAQDNHFPADDLLMFVYDRYVGPYKNELTRAVNSANAPVKTRAQAPTAEEIKNAYLRERNVRVNAKLSPATGI